MALSTLAQIIQSEGLTGTAAEVLTALTTSGRPVALDTLRSSKDTLIALQSAGIDAETVVAAVKSTNVGQMLLDKLSSEGVNWRDPLTKQLLSSLVTSHPDFTQQMADVLVGMNEYTVSIVDQYAIPTPTEAEVQTALDAIAFESDWTAAQNTHINAAVAAGDRAGLVAALRASANDIEGLQDGGI